MHYRETGSHGDHRYSGEFLQLPRILQNNLKGGDRYRLPTPGSATHKRRKGSGVERILDVDKAVRSPPLFFLKQLDRSKGRSLLAGCGALLRFGWDGDVFDERRSTRRLASNEPVGRTRQYSQGSGSLPQLGAICSKHAAISPALSAFPANAMHGARLASLIQFRRTLFSTSVFS